MEITRPRNPSIQNISQGLKPIHTLEFSDGTLHFIFSGGKDSNGRYVGFIHRRQIGEGHSQIERIARREKRNADYQSRREYRRARRLETLEASEIVQQVAA